MAWTRPTCHAPTLTIWLHEEPVVAIWKIRDHEVGPARVAPPLQHSNQLTARTATGLSPVPGGSEIDGLVAPGGQQIVVPGAFVVISQQENEVARSSVV